MRPPGNLRHVEAPMPGEKGHHVLHSRLIAREKTFGLNCVDYRLRPPRKLVWRQGSDQVALDQLAINDFNQANTYFLSWKVGWQLDAESLRHSMGLEHDIEKVGIPAEARLPV